VGPPTAAGYESSYIHVAQTSYLQSGARALVHCGIRQITDSAETTLGYVYARCKFCCCPCKYALLLPSPLRKIRYPAGSEDRVKVRKIRRIRNGSRGNETRYFIFSSAPRILQQTEKLLRSQKRAQERERAPCFLSCLSSSHFTARISFLN